MKITSPENVEPRARKLAIGEFDGVHAGHVAVIGDSDTVLTFDPHPRAVVDPKGAPALLTTAEQRAELIADLGVAELVVAKFDTSFSQLTPEQFVDQIVVGALGASEVRVGANFRFGEGARGTSSTLAADSRFSTSVAEIVEWEGRPVSSTAIRKHVAAGEIRAANGMLGHRFAIRGIVSEGAQRGRDLGFPTANLEPSPGIAIPRFGVYAGLANGLPAAVSIGVRPMFDDGDAVLVETHILDFDGDLYGQSLDVELLEFLRDERIFDEVAEMQVQMEADCADSLRIAQLAAKDS